MSNYYVLHKNPKHPDIIDGEEWAVDEGSFTSRKKAEQHAERCEYRVRSITHKVVTEEEFLEIIGKLSDVREVAQNDEEE